MAKLSHGAKRLIVQRLATFVTPSEIKEELQGTGVAVSLQQLAYYDPASQGTELAQELRELFTVTRERFIAETVNIAVSHRTFRLRELERLYRKAASGTRPNVVLAAQLLKQAAEETGGAYTNRRDITAKLGGSLEVHVTRKIVRPGEQTPLPPHTSTID